MNYFQTGATTRLRWIVLIQFAVCFFVFLGTSPAWAVPPKKIVWFSTYNCGIRCKIGQFENDGNGACKFALALEQSKPENGGLYTYTNISYIESDPQWGTGCKYTVYDKRDKPSDPYPPYTTSGHFATKVVGLYCHPGTAQEFNTCKSQGEEPWKNQGPPCCKEGNPINAATGTKWQEERDYVSGGSFPINISRGYNSTARPKGTPPFFYFAGDYAGWTEFTPYPPFTNWGEQAGLVQSSGAYSHSLIGEGDWRHVYDRTLMVNVSPAETVASRIGGDRRARNFVLSGENTWQPDTGEEDGKLERMLDANLKVTGWKYTSSTDEVETYDADGKLLSLRTRSGYTQTFYYNALNQLEKITDSFGRSLLFFYGASNGLEKITDPANGDYLFTYDDTPNLVKVTSPDGGYRQYVYGDERFPYALTAIVDENGKAYATWTYDAKGRAISSEHAGGVERVTLSFDTNTSIAVDILGNQRTYAKQVFNGFVRVTGINEMCGTNCSRSYSFGYDAKGNVSSRTDWNGNVTTYTYDTTRNLETQRVEGSGTAQARTISTQWHATYRIPTAITGSLKRTTFAYDNHGNLLSKTEQATTDITGAQGFNATTVGTPRTWSYTYNDVGQVLTATDPKSSTTIYTYDSQGNLATITNAAGHVTTLSNYDANGRVGRIVDPNGLTTDLTYSPRGWLVSRKAGSETTSYGYDGVGQLKKVTNPDGSFIAYTYDDAHRLTDIADSTGNSLHYTLDAIGNRIKEEIKDPAGNLARQITRVYDALSRLQQVTGAMQ